MGSEMCIRDRLCGPDNNREPMQPLNSMLGPFIDLWADLPRVSLDGLFEGTDLKDRFEPLSSVRSDITPAILAPLALAAQSRGLIDPNSAQLSLIRSALVADPEYVQTGYVQAMQDKTLWKELN